MKLYNKSIFIKLISGFLFSLVVCLSVSSNTHQALSTSNLQSSSSEEFTFTEIGRWSIADDVFFQDVIVDDNIAYVCTRNYLAILDISDPEQPFLLSNFTQFGNYYIDTPWPQKALLFGDYLLVLAYWHDMIYCWTNKIMILDISDPFNPLVVQEFNENRLIYEIQIVDNFLYVASSGDFRIYNLENVNSPTLLCNFSIENFFPSSISIHNSFAFLSSYDDGYLVLDISNPSDPFIVKNCTDFSFTSIHFEGSIAYALIRLDSVYTDNDYNFTIFNVTNDYDFEEINHYYIIDDCWDFVCSDGYVYIKTIEYDLLVLNATDFYHLEIVYESMANEPTFPGFSIIGNYFYLAAGSDGFIIYQVNYPPISVTINLSAILLFIVSLFSLSLYLKKKISLN
ncbi:MAG: hypothetical protein FK734_03185 [Asgard group archaeon]|nr:hypothetical protein [Asgard group archaeon]